MDEQLLVRYGGELKALSNNKLGGYLVVFGDESNTDLVGDFFTQETNFYVKSVDGHQIPALYHHGLDAKIGNRILGEMTLKMDEVGVWMETQLQMRDDYDRAIEELARQGKLGLSSGSLPSLVNRQPTANGKAHKITSWGLDEGSFTPAPCEPRTFVYEAKSLPLDDLLAQVEGSLPTDETEAKAKVSVELSIEVCSDDPNAEGEQPEDGLPSVEPVDGEGTDMPMGMAAVPYFGDKSANDTRKTTPPQPDSLMKTEEEEPVNAEELKSIVIGAVNGAVAPLQAEIETMKLQMKAAPAQPQGGVVVPGEFKAKADPDAELKAYEDYMRHGVKGNGLKFFAGGVDMKAAMAEGAVGTGGYLVPNVYSSDLIKIIYEGSYLRMAGSRQYTMPTGAPLKKPALTNSSAATLTTEAAAITEAEPTVGEVVWTPYKFSKLAKVSNEMLYDSRIPLDVLLNDDAAYGFGQAENTYFTTGTGSGQPQGIVTGSSLGATAASATTIGYDDILKLFHSLSFQYRAGSVFMANDAVVQALRLIKDTTGRPIWQSSLTEGQPETLLGRPLFVNNSMASTLAATTKSMLFFNPRYFEIVDFMEVTVKRLDELYAATDQTGFTWIKRSDSRVTLSAAVKHLIH